MYIALLFSRVDLHMTVINIENKLQLDILYLQIFIFQCLFFVCQLPRLMKKGVYLLKI